MAEKKVKTAAKGSRSQKQNCPSCGSDCRVVLYAGFGKTGYFWTCDADCGFMQRTR